MKILIVKLGSIGDIVHTLPTLAAIRAAMPNTTISWVAETRSAEILRGNSLIDDLIEVDTRSLRDTRSVDELFPAIASQVRDLRSRKFDIALDFQGLLKSGMIAKLSGAKARWGFARKNLREPASRVFLTDTVASAQFIHVIRKNLELAHRAVSIPVPDRDFQFPIETDATHKEEARRIASAAEGPFAILNPAGGWVTKLWPAEKFGQLADRIWTELKMRSVVVTGPRESDLARTVFDNHVSDSLLLAQPTLKGFVELARLSSLYVGGDTGPTHLAVAARSPVVGLFGPTEWWRNGSPHPGDICVERTDIGCRIDCHRRTCSNWICMDSDVDSVFSAVKLRVAEQPVQV